MPAPENDMNGPEYKPVKFHELLPNQVFGFDIFLRLPKNKKYLKYINADEAVSAARIARLRLKNVNELFIRAGDLPGYNRFFSQSIVLKLKNSSASNEEKTNTIKVAARNLIESVNTLAANEDSTVWSNHCVEITRTIVTDLADVKLSAMFDKLAKLLSSEHSLLSHSLSVSALSVVTGMALGIFDPGSLSELSIGGLLHDVGLAKLPHELLDKYLRMQQMTPGELDLFRQHPTIGGETVKGIFYAPVITANVIRIILEHHENESGTGFPDKLPPLRQSRLVKMTSLADRLALEMSNAKEPGFDIKSMLLMLLKKQETGPKEFDSGLLAQLLGTI